MYISCDPPVAKLALRNGQLRPLSDEELESHVLFSGAFIDFEGAFKLTTVVTAYAKAYEGEDWRLELKHFNDKNNGFSTDHLPSQVGLTANDGCIKMVDCGHHNEKMFCGRGPKQFGWKNYEREAGTNQIVGMAIHETWMRPGKTDGQWTVQDLCEIVLCRYRVKRPNKLGSWLYGARARIAVDDDEKDTDPESLPTLLKLSKYCGNQGSGAWAIIGQFV